MRILLVGAGGVGSAFTAIAARRDFFDLCVVADYDEARSRRAVEALSSTARATTGSWPPRSTPPMRRRSRRSCVSTRSRT